jgi:hypothetical protein
MFAWCFIERFRAQEEYQKINPPLVEKRIHALSLVQQLQVQGLDFILRAQIDRQFIDSLACGRINGIT